MNPFKLKQLEEFTIADCETYISKYPSGEHILEVKRLLRELKKQKEADKPKETKGTINNNIKTYDNKPDSHTKDTTPTKNITNGILAWILIIVIVIVAGTIIISILSKIIPYEWWDKYRYLIYPACIVLVHFLKKEFN